MKRLALPSAGLRKGVITLASLATLYGFLLSWHAQLHGSVGLLDGSALAVFLFLSWGYGHTFGTWLDPLLGGASVAREFVAGFLIFNTLLFVAALLLPHGLLASVALLAGILLALQWPAWRSRRRHPPADDAGSRGVEWAAFAVSGIAATLWCRDQWSLMNTDGVSLVVQAWQDVFYHARQLSAFAQSQGAASISDIRLAGVPAQIYHFGSYLSAAALLQALPVHALEVYASFLFPLGIVLSGLAAFCLFAPLLGRWPALAACTALLLLPDAYHQGFGIRYTSYQFLAQVSVGMLYGLACAALSWLFVLQGCLKGRLALVILGYGCLLLTLFYKAHFFVANAFVLMVYPCFFYRRLAWRWRIPVGVLLVATFLAVVSLSQAHSRVPVLRLDGSGIGGYLAILLQMAEPGHLKAFFASAILQGGHAQPVKAVYAATMLLLTAFGCWCLVLAATWIAVRKRLPAAIAWFPVVVLVNFLVMTMGLAMDDRSIGTADELLNRPMVWAYFGIVTWSAAVAYSAWVGDALPRGVIRRGGLLALVFAGLLTTWSSASNLQTYPVVASVASYRTSHAVDQCLAEAAFYIRDRAGPRDVMQDSGNDPKFAVTAMAERQRFAGVSIFGAQPVEAAARLEALDKLRQMTTAQQVRAFARENGIDWYLLQPQSAVAWPAAFLEQADFRCGDYRVFRFTR